jgi:AcrR family transcriptional regulator
MNVHSKRENVLTATADRIFERGLESVSMAEIARHAGVGMGTIYNYFASKEELVGQVFVRVAREMSEATLAGYSDDAAPMDRLRHLAQRLLRWGLENPREILLFEQLNHSPYINAEIQNHDYGVKRVFFELIKEADAAGRIKPLPAVLIGNALVSFVASVVRTHIRNGIEITPQTERTSIDAWIDCITATHR